MVFVYDVYTAVYITIDGEDQETSPSLSETAELQQKIQDLHKLHLSQRQEIVQRDTQIEQLVSSIANSDCLNIKLCIHIDVCIHVLDTGDKYVTLTCIVWKSFTTRNFVKQVDVLLSKNQVLCCNLLRPFNVLDAT